MTVKRENATQTDPAGTKDTMSPPFRSLMGAVLFLAAIFFLNFISRIVFAPLMPAIQRDLGIAHAASGSLFLLISFGYFFALMISGFVSCRLNHRRTIILSSVMVGVSLLVVVLSNGIFMVQAGLLLLGLSAGLYLSSGMATVTAMVPQKHWGKAIATHELAPNLSFIAAPLLAELFMPFVSWRGVLLFLSAGSVLLGLAFARFGKGGDFYGEAPRFGALKDLFSSSGFWIMVALFSLGITSTLGVYTMLPLYLVAAHGMARPLANTLVALSRIPGLFMAFVAGWASDRFGHRSILIAVFLMTGLFTIFLGVVSSPWLIFLIFAQPVIAVCFFPPAFSSLSALGTAKTRNIAISFTVPMAFVMGGGAVPLGIGVMADAGSFALGISLTGCLLLLGSLVSLGLKSSKQ